MFSTHFSRPSHAHFRRFDLMWKTRRADSKDSVSCSSETCQSAASSSSPSSSSFSSSDRSSPVSAIAKCVVVIFAVGIFSKQRTETCFEKKKVIFVRSSTIKRFFDRWRISCLSCTLEKKFKVVVEDCRKNCFWKLFSDDSWIWIICRWMVRRNCQVRWWNNSRLGPELGSHLIWQSLLSCFRLKFKNYKFQKVQSLTEKLWLKNLLRAILDKYKAKSRLAGPIFWVRACCTSSQVLPRLGGRVVNASKMFYWETEECRSLQQDWHSRHRIISNLSLGSPSSSCL